MSNTRFLIAKTMIIEQKYKVIDCQNVYFCNKKMTLVLAIRNAVCLKICIQDHHLPNVTKMCIFAIKQNVIFGYRKCSLLKKIGFRTIDFVAYFGHLINTNIEPVYDKTNKIIYSTALMPRLIRVFIGCQDHALVKF